MFIESKGDETEDAASTPAIEARDGAGADIVGSRGTEAKDAADAVAVEARGASVADTRTNIEFGAPREIRFTITRLLLYIAVVNLKAVSLLAVLLMRGN